MAVALQQKWVDNAVASGRVRFGTRSLVGRRHRMVRHEGGRWNVGIEDNAVYLERISESDEKLFDDLLAPEEARQLAGLLCRQARRVRRLGRLRPVRGLRRFRRFRGFRRFRPVRRFRGLRRVVGLVCGRGGSLPSGHSPMNGVRAPRDFSCGCPTRFVSVGNDG